MAEAICVLPVRHFLLVNDGDTVTVMLVAERRNLQFVIDRLVLWRAFTVVATVPMTKSDTSADLLPPEDQYLSLFSGRRITNATTFKLVPCRE